MCGRWWCPVEQYLLAGCPALDGLRALEYRRPPIFRAGSRLGGVHGGDCGGDGGGGGDGRGGGGGGGGGDSGGGGGGGEIGGGGGGGICCCETMFL